MIKKYSLIALQKAINRALAMDETSADRINSLDGKVLEIVISPLNVFFFIAFNNNELQLLDSYDNHPDTVIHSSPIGLIRLSLLPTSKVRSLFNDKIRISGDVELGQQVKALFDDMDIDWEGHLAHFTGDVVAHQVGCFVREKRSLKDRITSSLQRNVTEYLQEELRLFPTSEEINDFFNDVDELSLRTERLAAHVNQLLIKHEFN
ncbi:MAG: SCP2 sterol-binding domain-containing protein [Legionellaceae bacterium]|nr:SCP2 sterol-binding domain-containing protein [Legionellaceae bacterium]